MANFTYCHEYHVSDSISYLLINVQKINGLSSILIVEFHVS